MLHINEDEVTRMLGKLNMLSMSRWITRLGYTYRDNANVIIDVRGEDYDYCSPHDIDIIESMITPTLGEGGYIDSNYNKGSLLKQIGAEVPKSKYDEDDIMGTLYFINNPNVLKFIEYKLESNEMLKKTLHRFSCSYYDDESSVDRVQIIFNEKGLYIVWPDRYTDVEEFLNDYIWLMQHIGEQVREYEIIGYKEEVA